VNDFRLHRLLSLVVQSVLGRAVDGMKDAIESFVEFGLGILGIRVYKEVGVIVLIVLPKLLTLRFETSRLEDFLASLLREKLCLRPKPAGSLS
jgi:hypothetical protein